MDIRQILSPVDTVANVRASDKASLLQELCARAALSLKLEPADIYGAILKREELGSTGVGGGVAIPHARIEKIAKPFGLLARLRKPVDFEAIDGEPVDIVFLLLLPQAKPGEQLNTLAAVARKLRSEKTVGGLRQASDSAGLFEAMMASGE